MSGNYYDDADGGHGASAAEPSGDKEESTDSQTALIPKSFFSKELKPGDKCDIEVVRVHEDAVEVKGCESTQDEEQPPEDAPAPSGDESGGDGGGMSSMME